MSNTNYPVAIDTPVDPNPADFLNTPGPGGHAGQHGFENDAIVALETKVGKNGDTNHSSHDYKLSEILLADKAVGKTAIQTLTNKTLTAPVVTNASSTGTDSGAETLQNKTLSTGTVTALGSDTLGDLYYRGPGGILARLGIGVPGQNLGVSGGLIPQWQNTSFNPNWLMTAGENISAAGKALYVGYFQIGAAILYDTKTSFTNAWSGLTTAITHSVTIASNSNRILVVSFGSDFAAGGVGTISAISYAGVPLTAAQTNSAGIESGLYYLLNPATGANNLQYTVNSAAGPNNGEVRMVVYSLYNVAGVSSSAKVNTGSDTSITGTVDYYGNDIIFGFKGGHATIGTVSSVQCPIQTQQGSGSRICFFSGATNIIDVSGSVACTCTFVGGTLTDFDSMFVIGLSPSNAAVAGYAKLATTSNTLLGGTDRWVNFIGFSAGAATVGNPVTVYEGYITGLSGLFSNQFQYLTNTAGVIGNSPGSNTKKVGISLSTTTLLMKDSI